MTIKNLITAGLVASLYACGGGSDSATATGGDNTQTGIFLDSPVINIGYRTETLEGVTGPGGEYRYLPGETVTFFIGRLELPPVAASGTVTPLDLAGTRNIKDPTVINIIRLLQTLDKDGDPANGITITQAAVNNAAQLDFKLPVTDFSALPAVKQMLESAGQDSPVSILVAPDMALAHFESQLESGSYISFELNVQKVITGDPLGRGTDPVASLRKPLVFSITAPDERLSFGAAYALRSSSRSDAAYWIVSVKNLSGQTLCLIKLVNGTLRDSSGQTLATLDGTYANGSVQRLQASGLETGTCLLPGQTGIVSGIDTTTGVYANLSEIVFESISVGPYEIAASSPVLIPADNYTVTSTGYSQSFTVAVTNTGTETAMVGQYVSAFYTLLDDLGLPLLWGYMSRPADWDGTLPVGSSNRLEESYFSYGGQAGKMTVNLDYETYIPGSAPAAARAAVRTIDFAGPDDYNRYLLDLRDQNEDYKRALTGR